MIKYSNNEIPKEADIEFLYSACKWWHAKIPQRMIRALKGAWRYVTAWDDDELVGLIYAISDGELYAYITHVLVHPQYRRRGIGTGLMHRLIKDTEKFENIVIIAATPEARQFYETVGFSLMKPGPGMKPQTLQRFKCPI